MKFLKTEQENEREKRKKNFLHNIDPIFIIEEFPMFVDRQVLIRYLVRYELFKKILNVIGSIVECGVYSGASLMLYSVLSSIYEPYAFKREIIGFDTFGSGFPSVDEKDGSDALVGDMAHRNFEILQKCIEFYDQNRPISHIPKVKLVKGDAIQTIPKYFEENRHQIVAMLYLDFDLYASTKVALETILPRMPKGSIIAFDELNDSRWPGETIALLECLNINNYEINKFPEDPHISWIRL